jgi:hypothetical protein
VTTGILIALVASQLVSKSWFLGGCFALATLFGFISIWKGVKKPAATNTRFGD